MDRIAVDVTPTITGRTGIARYVKELATALERLPDAPEVVRFAVGRAVVPVSDPITHIRWPLRVVGPVWQRVHRPRLERFVGAVDSVHASGALLPPSRAPVVAVVHDLTPIDHPDLHPARDVAQLQRYLDGLRDVRAVIAVSETTAAALRRRGVPGDHVHVVPNGRTEFPAPIAPPLEGRPYVLAVGAPVPRKGFHVLVRALVELASDDVVLAIAGPPGSDDDALTALAGELGVRDRIHRATAVSDAELAGWYQHAAVLAAPSVEEGFGLPLIEALAVHVPVVASDLPVFHEVTGSHALLVPSGDVSGFADAIRAAIERGPSVESMVELGAAHVTRYTWDACAAATLAVHRSVSL
jgi:glycosyltransferase involved in cell wall biosynthesis